VPRPEDDIGRGDGPATLVRTMSIGRRPAEAEEGRRQRLIADRGHSDPGVVDPDHVAIPGGSWSTSPLRDCLAIGPRTRTCSRSGRSGPGCRRPRDPGRERGRAEDARDSQRSRRAGRAGRGGGGRGPFSSANLAPTTSGHRQPRGRPGSPLPTAGRDVAPGDGGQLESGRGDRPIASTRTTATRPAPRISGPRRRPGSVRRRRPTRPGTSATRTGDDHAGASHRQLRRGVGPRKPSAHLDRRHPRARKGCSPAGVACAGRRPARISTTARRRRNRRTPAARRPRRTPMLADAGKNSLSSPHRDVRALGNLREVLPEQAQVGVPVPQADQGRSPFRRR